jgi:hypothetical protein
MRCLLLQAGSWYIIVGADKLTESEQEALEEMDSFEIGAEIKEAS